MPQGGWWRLEYKFVVNGLCYGRVGPPMHGYEFAKESHYEQR